MLDPETSEPAAPGALGTLVITPYFPYRECMRLRERDMPVITQPISLLQQNATELGVILVGSVLVSSGALVYLLAVPYRRLQGVRLASPVAFLCSIWMRRRYGRERTMAEYLASAEAAEGAPAATQPTPMRRPASV